MLFLVEIDRAPSGSALTPDRWLPIMRYINFAPAAAAAFAVGGRQYAVFAHDWRRETFDAWWEHEAELSLVGEPEPDLVVGPKAAPLVVLSEPEFADSVRRGLRDYARPPALSVNPLLHSRVVRDAAGGAPTVANLQAVLREAVEHLKESPRDEKFYRALSVTYLQPARSQERAAERLGLAFGTYRYHLARGIAQVVDWLWQRELRGL